MNIEQEKAILQKLKAASIGEQLLIRNTQYFVVPNGWLANGTFVPNPDVYRDLQNRMDAVDSKLKALLDKDKS